KMMPTPAPAPPMPMQAIPAPMYFAATGSMRKLLCWIDGRLVGTSVSRMKCVVDVDAGEDGEHVGLQERDQRLQRSERDSERERQRGAGPADHAEAAEQGDEAGEHFQGDVAGQ